MLRNKVQIVPVQQALMSNHIYKQLEREGKKIPTLSKEHASKKLLKEFGGRKASRFVDNREQMMVNVDVVRQDLDETVKSVAQNEDEDEDTLADVTVNNDPDPNRPQVPAFAKYCPLRSEARECPALLGRRIPSG